MTQDRTEGVEPETAVPAEEADANPVAGGTQAMAGSNGEDAAASETSTNGEASEDGRASGDGWAMDGGQASADGWARADDAPTDAEGAEATDEAGFAESADDAGADDATDAGTIERSAAVSDEEAAEAQENAETSESGRASADGSDAHTTNEVDVRATHSSPAEEAPEAAVAERDDTSTADEAQLAAAVSDDDSGAATESDDDRGAAAESDDAGVSDDDAAHAPAAVEDDEPVPVVDTRPEPTTMEELLAEQSTDIRSLKHGDVVEGNVVRIDKDEILVDIGAKSEGVVSNRELYGRNAESQPQLNIGDTVLVYVLQPESNEGHAVLSLRRAGLERKWRSMQEQLDAGVIIEAPVIDHNKGGLIVDCGIRGFVPISQIVDFPRRPQNEQPRDAAQEIAEKLQPYVGRKLRLKILEVNRKANRLILSEKVALYEERREKRDELFSSLKVGQQVKGTVRSIAPFGVFVDLGGIDGLVHKSELSWNKVNNPEAGYRVGEEVEAEVIDINHERGRISLSIRRLQPDPWHSTVADLKVNDVIEGTVTKIVNFGAFVRVREGLEGLIHISELSQQRVAHPGDVVHEGQKLNLKVISLDSERHRLGLSLKQAEETAPARPAVTEGTGAPAAAGTSAPRERSERRGGGRSERSGYDASQAVQEPEGGIDNTLAAAFAQVRQQMAEQENAASGDESEADDGEDAPLAQAEETSDQPAPVAAETSDAEVMATDEVVTPEGADASADAEEPEAVAASGAAPAADSDSIIEDEVDHSDDFLAPAETSDAEAMATDEVFTPESTEASEDAEDAGAGRAADGGAEGSSEAPGEELADQPDVAAAETSDAEVMATDEVVTPEGAEASADAETPAYEESTSDDGSSSDEERG